ncbi:site-specific DNA-methyltransferase [Salmonella enterica]
MECLIGMRMMLADNSIDAVVTDPPYGLSKQPDMSEVLRHWLNGDDYIHTGGGFMGKTWDSFVPGPSIWKEVFRVLKPGGHLLAFFGTRTYDLGTLAIRLAGFEIRDQIDWVYGSGFPKSLDVSKATGDEQWEGWGTALKPAHEPICVARKPLAGTVAENVMQFGTGGMNIDNCRIDSDGSHKRKYQPTNNERKIFSKQKGFTPTNAEGRFPANFVHDGSDEVVSLFPAKAGAAAHVKGIEQSQASMSSAARFFYSAKASKSDRDEGVLLAKKTAAEMTDREPDTDGLNSPRAGAGRTSGTRNNHPTVKPTALMQWLVRLVTPPGGKVLDPFMGSGSTGKACAIEGFDFIGFEMDPHYCEIAKQRINYVHNR